MSMIDVDTQSLLAILRDGGVWGEGCDEWQIADVEQQLRVELPAAYKAFLLLAGQGFAPFEGSQYAIEDDLAAMQVEGKHM